MEVHLTPEQEAQLAQMAIKAGTDAERLVKDAALRLLEADAHDCLTRQISGASIYGSPEEGQTCLTTP
jgi:hypothetical protein